MKIVKQSNPHMLQYFEAARLSNFATAMLVSIGNDGKLHSRVSEEFALSGLLGFNATSVIIFGVAATKDGFAVQQRQVPDRAIESFLAEHLQGVPGLQSVEYTRHIVDDGEIAIAVPGWDRGTQSRILEALGANFTPISWNMLVSDRKSVWRNEPSFSARSLEQYVELRRTVAPDAIELRFDADCLPTLLGFHQERDIRSATLAAFGNNGGVSSALYIRSGAGKRLSRTALRVFTQGASTERLKSLERMSAEPFLPDPIKNTGRGSHPAYECVKVAGYSLGRDVFQVIDNVAKHVCSEHEFFRNGVPVPQGFVSDRFATALRELIVNAFCHGAWGAHEVGRDDSERMEATRIAVVHAENRLEIINRLRNCGFIWNQLGTETSARRSALHNAFVDIKHAHGRAIGLQLVRQRIAKLGLPSPIFVRSAEYHRAIIPISLTSPGWCVFVERPKDYDERILHVYTLFLAQILEELDEDILASAFYIRREQASDALMTLASMGALRRQIDKVNELFHSHGHSKAYLPRYCISDSADVSSFIEQLTSGMRFFSSPPQISLGGHYQLSMRSMSMLVDADLQNYIHKLYNFELVNTTEAVGQTKQHMDILKGIESVHRRFE